MKLSSTLLEIWNELEQNFTSTATAVDCFGKRCWAWDQAAVAWDSVGILEKHFFSPDTGKYSKHYNEVVKILQECMRAQNALGPDLEYDADVHAMWWGAILTARVDEQTNKRKKQK